MADDPQVAGLEFRPALVVHLRDGSSYVLSYAEAEERFFLKIRGQNEVQQVAITIDESEEELKEKAEKLSRADEIDAFNDFHGSWVYEITSFTAEKLKLGRAELLESKDT